MLSAAPPEPACHLSLGRCALPPHYPVFRYLEATMPKVSSFSRRCPLFSATHLLPVLSVFRRSKRTPGGSDETRLCLLSSSSSAFFGFLSFSSFLFLSFSFSPPLSSFLPCSPPSLLLFLFPPLPSSSLLSSLPFFPSFLSPFSLARERLEY